MSPVSGWLPSQGDGGGVGVRLSTVTPGSYGVDLDGYKTVFCFLLGRHVSKTEVREIREKDLGRR